MTLEQFRQNALRMLTDAEVFGRWFTLPTWRGWLAVFYALFGIIPPDDESEAMVQRLTGRSTCPTRLASTVLLLVGRGGGKSFVSAVVTLLWAIRDYSAILAPGEVPVCMVIAADRRQARVVMGYIRGLLKAFSIFSSMLKRSTATTLELTNGTVIEIHTASFRSLRGYRVVCCVGDECAFWSVEGANPDQEIIRALGPALARTPGSLLLLITSPYARRGEAWRLYREHFGKDDSDVLVIQADTRTLNPTFDQGEIDRAYRDDPQSAAAEYGAQFRSDLEQFVSVEVLDAVTVPDRVELPPVPGVRYRAFVDPSGGSSDSMTLAIGHESKDKRLVLDFVDEVQAPFDPPAVVERFAATLKRYRIREVTGDHYGGDWPAAAFRKNGISYKTAEKSKNEIYREFLPMLTGGQVELLDHAVLRKQLLALERRMSRGGRELIDHPPRMKDDVANAVAGVCVLMELLKSKGPMVAFVGGDDVRMARIAAGIVRPETPSEMRYWMQICRDRDEARKMADLT
jgi:hypothetical protein